MPFDNTPTPTPTLADLGRLLRHPEEWPPGFEWDYSHGTTCALGLAAIAWDLPAIHMVPHSIAYLVHRTLPGCIAMRAVQPHHVADAIDRHLVTPGIV